MKMVTGFSSSKLLKASYGLSLLLASGCFGLQAVPYGTYVLNPVPDGEEFSCDATPSETRLLIQNVGAEGSASGTRITFKKSDIEEGEYQDASWNEAPASRLTSVFLDSISDNKRFKSVSLASDGTVGDLQLNITLTELVHDVQETPGEVYVGLRAEIISLPSRKSVASGKFLERFRVEEASAAGAVKAFGKAMGLAETHLNKWLCHVPLK